MVEEQKLYKDFRKLFHDNYADLRKYAYKYLHNAEESSDAVQECFIRFWEIKKEISAEAHAINYLRVSVRNKCISILRKRTQLAAADGLVDIENEINPDPDSNLTAHELIEKALNQLPPKCGIVFKMSRIEKMSYKEIAQQLQISVKTVENQMGKAIVILKKFAKSNYIPYLILLTPLGLARIGILFFVNV
ncbi:MAG: RNA polymerase sigma-70 factor [Sphingobacteriaceae bacterium]|nr:RNA polymerase sigma-70 factor [Sphingobacteriaceae bacterium]